MATRFHSPPQRFCDVEGCGCDLPAPSAAAAARVELESYAMQLDVLVTGIRGWSQGSLPDLLAEVAIEMRRIGQAVIEERNDLARQLADVRDELDTARREHAEYRELEREANLDMAELQRPYAELVNWLVTLDDTNDPARLLERRTVRLADIIARAQAVVEQNAR